MAKLFTALYDDQPTATQVIYSLVNSGTSRHHIAVISADKTDFNPGTLTLERVEKAAEPYRKEINAGKILIIAWAFGQWEKKAAEALQAHNPIAFDEKRVR